MLNIANFSKLYYTGDTLPPVQNRTLMKTEMFSSLRVIHSVAVRTALSVAVSVALATSFAAAPIDAFAKTPTSKSTKKAVKGAVAAPQAKAVKSSKVAARSARAVKGAKVASDGASIAFALPPVEVAVPHGLPLPGARTALVKVLSESADAHSLKLELEAEADSVVELKVRRNVTKLNLHVDGGTIEAAPDGTTAGVEKLVVKFPSGVGYQGQAVTIRW